MTYTILGTGSIDDIYFTGMLVYLPLLFLALFHYRTGVRSLDVEEVLALTFFCLSCVVMWPVTIAFLVIWLFLYLLRNPKGKRNGRTCK